MVHWLAVQVWQEGLRSDDFLSDRKWHICLWKGSSEYHYYFVIWSYYSASATCTKWGSLLLGSGNAKRRFLDVRPYYSPEYIVDASALFYLFNAGKEGTNGVSTRQIPMTKVDVQFTVIGPFSIHHAAKLISVNLGRSNPNTGRPKQHDFVCIQVQGVSSLKVHWSKIRHFCLFVIQTFQPWFETPCTYSIKWGGCPPLLICTIMLLKSFILGMDLEVLKFNLPLAPHRSWV